MMASDADAWVRALEELSPAVHPVDRVATRIWFRFFPLRLAEAVAGASDIVALERTLRLEGRYRLADQVGDRAFDVSTQQEAGASPLRKSPDEICSRRKVDDGQGVFGIFRGDRKRYSAWFDERRSDGRFPVVNQSRIHATSRAIRSGSTSW